MLSNINHTTTDDLLKMYGILSKFMQNRSQIDSRKALCAILAPKIGPRLQKPRKFNSRPAAKCKQGAKINEISIRKPSKL